MVKLHLWPHLLPDRILHHPMDAAASPKWHQSLAAKGHVITEQQQITILSEQLTQLRVSNPAMAIPLMAMPLSVPSLIAPPQKYATNQVMEKYIKDVLILKERQICFIYQYQTLQHPQGFSLWRKDGVAYGPALPTGA